MIVRSHRTYLSFVERSAAPFGLHAVLAGQVVGKQPVLKPGEKFSYTSGCPLSTDSGIMVGTYQMETDKGETFSIEIPAFSLDLPGGRKTLN